MINNIEKLSLLNGVSGFESEVAQNIMKQLSDKCDVHIDNLGNVIAYKKGDKKPVNKIMLTTHIDEVGFIINYVEESGELRFFAVGNIDPRIIVGKRVLVGKNKLIGVIGTKPVHDKNDYEENNSPGISDLYIDLGSLSKAETMKHISMGDIAIFESEFTKLGNDNIMCKALDNRVNCAVLIQLLNNFTEYDIFGVFSVMHLVGGQGVKTAVNTIKPDIAIILDTTNASDIGDVSATKQICKLGSGPIISYMDRGVVYDQKLYKTIVETANSNNIIYQNKTIVCESNGSKGVQASNFGIKTLGLSIPCRYIHSQNCVMKYSDIEDMLNLLEKALVNINN